MAFESHGGIARGRRPHSPWVAGGKWSRPTSTRERWCAPGRTWTGSEALTGSTRSRPDDEEGGDTGRADVVVCNTPWIPGRLTSALEQGINDTDSGVLHRFISGLADHLAPQGEGWLKLSEHLGLRNRDALLDRNAEAGLTVSGTLETTPRHPRAVDDADPPHAARARERTMLWRLSGRAWIGATLRGSCCYGVR